MGDDFLLTRKEVKVCLRRSEEINAFTDKFCDKYLSNTTELAQMKNSGDAHLPEKIQERLELEESPALKQERRYCREVVQGKFFKEIVQVIGGEKKKILAKLKEKKQEKRSQLQILMTQMMTTQMM